MIKAIAFDFNGVIVDDEHLHFEAFRLTFAAYDIDLTREDYWAHYLALDDMAVIRAFREEYPRELKLVTDDVIERVKIDHYLRLVGAEVPIFPGAVDVVKSLDADYPMVIVSGARREEIETALAQAGIADCFRGIVAAEDVGRGKPDPESYVQGARILNRAGAEIVAIEDSVGGIEAARAAGLRVIAVAHTYTRERLDGADLVLDRIADLDPIVLRRFR